MTTCQVCNQSPVALIWKRHLSLPVCWPCFHLLTALERGGYDVMPEGYMSRREALSAIGYSTGTNVLPPAMTACRVYGRVYVPVGAVHRHMENVR